YVMAGIVVAALILGIVVSLLMTPRYRAQATVRIDNEAVKIVEGQDLDPAVAISDTGRYLNTQKQIVESRSLAAQVATSLRLDREDKVLELLAVERPDAELNTAQQSAARRQAIIEALQTNVDMEMRNDTRVAGIGFTSRDPVLSARIANAFATSYIAQNVRLRYETNAYARKVLSSQVEQARLQLQQTEREAIEYARRNRLIDTGDASTGASDDKGGGDNSGNARSITTASLVQLNENFITARSARIEAEARWMAARDSAGHELAEARTNPAIQGILASRAEVAARLAELRARYLDDQPQVREAAAQLAQLDAQLASAGRSLKNTIYNEYRAAVRAEGELAAAKEGLADETLSEQDRRVQLNLIARDAETQRTQLNDLLTRLNQVNAAADITTNNISMLDDAQVPESPVSPNIRKNLMIALALGLALAFLVAFAREALDDTLRSPEDAERKLGLPLLGTTPLVRDLTADALSERQGELNEAYYSIRSTIDYASSGLVNKVFLVTSSQPGEGKSTTALAVARDFARIGRRTLLVDADLRNPSLHRNLGLAKDTGFVDVLMQHRSFADTVVQDEIADLHVLPLGPIPPNPVQILSSDLIQNFIEDVRQHYDIVILDSAPVMGLADAPMLSRVADHVVLIVEANRAHFGQAKSAVRRLQDAGAALLGIVMTKFSFRDAGYSYDYHYSYYSYRSKQPAEASAD
ncbi:MAG: Tyrosine-protein kinase YwqD, partial [Pseudomonadota bacterium]